MTTEEKLYNYIVKANIKHNFYYDYSLVDKISAKNKITIICPIHGEFIQRSDHHLNGSICRKCNNQKNMMTTIEYIEKVKSTHNNFYDYSKTIYTGLKNKITIICPIHGEFKQIAETHLKNSGCKECFRDRQKSNLTNFINNANIKHNFYYDYSESVYIGWNHKIIIKCRKHGYFSTTPTKHLNGTGCPNCRTDNISESFIERSKKIHDNFYDYSKVKYITAKTNVEIICPIHGSFYQMPDKHLCGQKCRKCRESYGERTISKILENNNIIYIKQYGFKDCKDINKLFFDFYIPSLNTCIEFDGQQHFTVINLWGGEQGLINRQKKDNIKDNYCNENNITLLRIRYDENIEEKIKHIYGK